MPVIRLFETKRFNNRFLPVKPDSLFEELRPSLQQLGHRLLYIIRSLTEKRKESELGRFLMRCFIENGKRSIILKNIVRLANALEADPRELFQGLIP